MLPSECQWISNPAGTSEPPVLPPSESYFMCGIMGIIGPRPDLDANRWGRLTSHRGPDAFGIWQDDDALLCHNRLSIIDLSDTANQPMVSDDDGLIIVFNGEIFNYLELRAELTAVGVLFRTQSDTEVVLNGFRRWGPSLLDRLDGMFAFAIWDTKSRNLFAARDHIGIKPFFYQQRSGHFAFGSELKLIEALNADLEIRDASIYEYLIYSYIPAPFTAYEDIFKLPPGHWLTYSPEDDQLKIGRWWSVPKPSGHPVTDLNIATERLRDVFGRAVRRRMIADVPLGAFLSGGMDSSAIVAEMALNTKAVQTFSIGYRDNPEYDETEYAEAVARHIGVDHKVLYPEFGQSALEEYLDLIVHHFDEPYGNPTVAMVHLLTAAAREHVTVALVGDGGDELFAGYPRHKALKVAAGARRWLGPMASLSLYALRMLPETPNGQHLVRRARQFLMGLDEQPACAFQQWSTVFTPEDLKNFNPSGKLSFGDIRSDYISKLFLDAQSDDVSSALYADLNSFVPFNLLEGADRMSMSNGFELRVPFVGREMIEFAATLSPELKIRRGVQKFVLKHAYAPALPQNIVRRRKRGFNPPMWYWMQSKQAFVRERLNNDRLRRYVPRPLIDALIDAFYTRRSDNSLQLWMLLVLAHWLDAGRGDTARLRSPIRNAEAYAV